MTQMSCQHVYAEIGNDGYARYYRCVHCHWCKLQPIVGPVQKNWAQYSQGEENEDT